MRSFCLKYNNYMKSKLSKQAFRSALPVFLAAIPLLTAITLFVLALILIELSGGLGVKDQSAFQQVVQTFGDITAALAYLCFTILTPLGIVSAIVLVIARFVARRVKD